MKCPNCRLINPDNALWCDCGYDFSSNTMKAITDMPTQERPAISGGKARELTIAEVSGRKVLAEIAGNNRYIIITEDIIYVGSTGIASGSFFGKKVKRYPIDSITSVDVRKALLTVELEFVMAGAVETGGTLQSFTKRSQNENITMFPKNQYEQVQRFANMIMDLQQARKRIQKSPSISALESKASIPEQIRELAGLKDAGILTIEEFEEKKKELLKRM